MFIDPSKFIILEDIQLPFRTIRDTSGRLRNLTESAVSKPSLPYQDFTVNLGAVSKTWFTGLSRNVCRETLVKLQSWFCRADWERHF